MFKSKYVYKTAGLFSLYLAGLCLLFTFYLTMVLCLVNFNILAIVLPSMCRSNLILRFLCLIFMVTIHVYVCLILINIAQIDFGSQRYVYAVATQGHSSTYTLSTYQLACSIDGNIFRSIPDVNGTAAVSTAVEDYKYNNGTAAVSTA